MNNQEIVSKLGILASISSGGNSVVFVVMGG